jgi:oligoendopeptidase F
MSAAAIVTGGLMVATAGDHAIQAAEAPTQDTRPAKAIAWDLTDLYRSPEAWDTEYAAVEKSLDGITAFKGKLCTDAKTMLSAFDAMSAALMRTYRLYGYASLKSDEDVRIAENTERKQKAQALITRYGEATSWVDPEVLAVGAAMVAKFQAAEPRLRDVHGFTLANTLRAAPHTLGPDTEAALATLGNIFDQPNNVYAIFADGELPFPTIKLSDGTEVKLDQAAFERLRVSPNRADRKLVFDAFWGAWQKYQGTLGANLQAEVIKNAGLAKVRHHKNALSAALFSSNLPETVYRTLVEQTNAGLPTLHRYLRLRKQLLGITDDMGYQDIYPSMFKGERKYPFEESKKIVFDALKPLGEEYLGILRDGLAKHWTHVYPETGKASGAYMMGLAYDVHPYVLLNHNDDYDSLSVLAHEWGHAVHTVLANRAQPFEKANYATFIAETASIMNEMILEDYLYNTASTREDKLFFLGQALESIRFTFFRQAMFAEFEAAIHDKVEAGEPLSGEKMTQMYCQLLKRYHGQDQGVMKIDENYCIEWAFLPHFYYDFYVFQYATSIAGAAMLEERVKTEGAAGRETFITMLKAGGSDYPYEIYKKAGLDMATPAPYQALIARMNRVLDEIETLTAKP